MKKVLYALCALMLVGAATVPFTSCSKDDDNYPSGIKELRFNITVNNASAPDSKAVKTAWADGDQIYVFFKAGESYLDAYKYVTLTYVEADNEWTGTLCGDLTDAADLGDAGTMYGIHFPFGGVAIASDGADGVTFLSSGCTNPELDGQPIYTYYMSGSTAYTVETAGDVATLTGSFNLTIPDDYVYFFIDKNGEQFASSEQYRLVVVGLKPVACTGFSAGTFSETELAARRPVWGYAYGTEGIAFSGKIDATWELANNHQLLLYDTADPAILSKTITAALQSLSSVKLRNPADAANGWKKNGFRGYEVSPGILVRDANGNYSLTDGSNPFEAYDYYGQAASKNKYYFQWGTLQSELGAAENNDIKADSERLPSGWLFPSGGNTTSFDWYNIFRGKPQTTISIEKEDGSIETISTTAGDKGVAYATITKEGSIYEGILLLRDGSFIPKEGNLQYWGKSSENNPLTYEQYLVLKDAGCLFLSLTGRYSGTFNEWRDMDEGSFWSCSYSSNNGRGLQAGYYIYNSLLSISPNTRSTDNHYLMVRLVKKL